jgi:polar amino acid transport system substrate-binding protein
MQGQNAKCLGVLALLALTVAPDVQSEELVIAFSLDTPPFVMDKAKSGIEVDIVRDAMKRRGYTFTTRQMPYGRLPGAVTEIGLDAAATVMQSDNGTFYSESYITFHNVAITKRSSGIKIDTIADLKGKSIVAWQNAYEELGPEFEALFSPQVREPYRKKYQEIADQKQQVEIFWQGEAEVIVIDKSVMRWFTNELAGKVNTSQALVNHEIFPAKTQFRISFRDKQVRDDFNAGLNEIRSSGLYHKIYDKYVK